MTTRGKALHVSKEPSDSMSEELLTKICKQQADTIYERMDARFGKIEDKLSSFVKQVNKNAEKIDSLEAKIDQNEQYVRLNNLRVYGLKEESGENQDNLLDKVIAMLKNKMDVSVTRNDLERCHRLGSSQRARAVLLCLDLLPILRSTVHQSKKL